MQEFYSVRECMKTTRKRGVLAREYLAENGSEKYRYDNGSDGYGFIGKISCVPMPSGNDGLTDISAEIGHVHTDDMKP